MNIADIEELSREFDQASDRSAAIVSASVLDSILQELLIEYLVQDEATDSVLFEGFGPLASFSAKITMSFRLGLISKEEYRLAHGLRKIRNVFAHEIAGVSFTNPKILDLCSKISLPVALLNPASLPLFDDNRPIPKVKIIKSDKGDGRGLYKEVTLFLVDSLGARIIMVNKKKCVSPPAFTTATASRKEMLHEMEANLAKLKNALPELDKQRPRSPEEIKTDEEMIRKNEALIRITKAGIQAVDNAERVG